MQKIDPAKFTETYRKLVSSFHITAWLIDQGYTCEYLGYSLSHNFKTAGVIGGFNLKVNKDKVIAYFHSMDDSKRDETISMCAQTEGMPESKVIAQMIIAGYRTLCNFMALSSSISSSRHQYTCSTDVLLLKSLGQDGFSHVKHHAGDEYLGRDFEIPFFKSPEFLAESQRIYLNEKDWLVKNSIFDNSNPEILPGHTNWQACLGEMDMWLTKETMPTKLEAYLDDSVKPLHNDIIRFCAERANTNPYMKYYIDRSLKGT